MVMGASSSFCIFDAVRASKIMNNPIIHFNFLESISLADRTRLKGFIIALFKRERKSLAQIRYIFCSDTYLLEINRQFLQHDYYTDIITFDLSEKGQPTNAEIYISVDRVRDNANQFESTLSMELHRVIFHGALHLCGFKDKTPQQEKEMRKMEEKYLSLYFT
jgi:rRNA maturation RNase YbeY